jgi:hypothetical protein
MWDYNWRSAKGMKSFFFLTLDNFAKTLSPKVVKKEKKELINISLNFELAIKGVASH